MKFFSLGLLLMGVFSATVVKAQKDDLKVSNAVELFRSAMVNADGKALDQLTHPSLSYGHSSGVVEDKKAFIDNIVNGPDFVKIELSDQTISITDDVAIVRHTFKGEMISNEQKVPVSIKVLLIWKKQKGDWKLIARQAFK